MHAAQRSSRPAAALHESSKLRRPAAPLLAPSHRVQPFRSIPPGHEDRHGRRVSLLKCASATANTSALNSLPAPDAAAAVAAAAESGQTLALSRRASLVLATIVVLGSSGPWRRGAAHAEEASLEASGEPGEAPEVALTEYVNTKQQYRLLVPAGWDVKGKAGADALFEDPARRSTSVGVTVNPVKVGGIRDFGTVEQVGERLLAAERAKESTLGVQLVSQSSRDGTAGATLYEYEYELDSTRGRKRILNTVTIFNSRLYILNAAYKCDKDGCGGEALRQVALLRRVASTFDVSSN